MTPEPAGERVSEGITTITLAEAMLVAREKSKLDTACTYKRSYDNNPGAMQKKNLNCY